MAVFVSNPRDPKGRFKKARRAATAPAKPKHHARARSTTRKANPPKQTRMFQAPARRTAKGKVKAVSTRKRGGKAGPRPRISRRWAYQRNPRGKAGRFVAKGRRKGSRKGGRRTRNALAISNPMSGVPVLGTALSMIGPAFFGAAGVEAIAQTMSLLRKYITVPEMLTPVEFTLGGLILAGLVQLFTFIPAPLRRSIGVGLASGGGAVDWYRYRSAAGAYGALEMGDGGDWKVEQTSYGDADAYGALEMSGLESFAGDEDYCGLDFSEAEGHAMAEGYGAYMSRFPLRKHPNARKIEMRPGRNTPAHEIHDPRREGDRWHWLAAMVGPEDARRVANMPPKQRVAQIAACKAACKGAIARPAAAPARRMIGEDVVVERPTPKGAAYDAFPSQSSLW